MKKLTSILLVTAMLIGIIPISSIAFAAKPDIDIYEAFENYSGGTELDNWRITMDTLSSTRGTTNVRSVSENSNKSIALYQNGMAELTFGKVFDEGKMHISFDVKKGNDENKENTNSTLNVFLRGLCDSTQGGENDQYDYSAVDATEKVANIGRNRLLNIDMNSQTPITYKDAWSFTGGSETATDTYSFANWNRVDIFIDQQPTGTESPYSVYMNGSKISTNETAISKTNASGAHTAIALGFHNGWKDDDNYKNYVMIDNVKVEQYSNLAPQPETKFVMGDNVAGIEKEVSVNFTEGLCKDPETGDIVIKNESGSVVDSSEYSIENATCMGFTLKTDGMTGGKYTMEFSEALAGCESGVQPESAEFYVTGLTDSADNTRYYYMNEDFNTYTGITTGTYNPQGVNYDYTNPVYGDVPVGWVDADTVGASTTEKDSVNRFWSNRTYMANATKERFIQPEQRDGDDYAVKISAPVGSANGNDWDEEMRYYFPTGAASGDFTLEFDVKHANGGWGITYVDLANWDSAFENSKGYQIDNTSTESENSSYASSALTAVEDKHMGKHLIGMTVNGTTLKYNDTIEKGNRIETDTEINMPKDTWTNVKIDFNLNTGKYLITVTPENGTAETFTWTDSKRGRFEKGVKGIGLRRYKGASGSDTVDTTVRFDNVKVYKTNSYYINDTFDDYDDGRSDTDTTGYMPSGWWNNGRQFVKQSSLYWVGQNSLKVPGIKSVAGRTDGNDKAVMVDQAASGNVLDGNVFFKAFPRAMGSGTPFVISFDLKTTAGAGWKLFVPNQSHLEYLYGFNVYATTLADGTTTFYSQASNWGNVQSKCVVLEKDNGTNKKIQGRQTSLYFANANHTTALSEIETEDDAWYTYTLTVTPSADGKAKVEVDVVNVTSDEASDGGHEEFELRPYQDNTNWYQWPAAGLGFAKVGDGNIYIDNVKVYETGAADEDGVVGESTAVPKENITDIRVEYSNGTTKSLTANTVGQTVEPSVKRIAVEFSSPISILESKDVLQPLDIVKTSKKVAEKTPSLVETDKTSDSETESESSATGDSESETVTTVKLSDVINTGSTMNSNESAFKSKGEGLGSYLEDYADCVSRYKVYDVLEDVIQFKRLGNQAETDDVEFKRYLSADRKTCYFEFDKLLKEDVDYVLTVDRNIPFSSSIYASLDESAIVKFGVKNTTVPGAYVTETSLERQAGAVTAPIKSIEDLKSQIENDKAVYMVVDGYNTASADVEMYAIAAQYAKDEVTGATVLVDCKCVPMTIAKQTTLSEPMKTELTDLTVGDNTNLIKCFVWKQANNAPLSEMSVFE